MVETPLTDDVSSVCRLYYRPCSGGQRQVCSGARHALASEACLLVIFNLYNLKKLKPTLLVVGVLYPETPTGS